MTSSGQRSMSHHSLISSWLFSQVELPRCLFIWREQGNMRFPGVSVYIIIWMHILLFVYHSAWRWMVTYSIFIVFVLCNLVKQRKAITAFFKTFLTLFYVTVSDSKPFSQIESAVLFFKYDSVSVFQSGHRLLSRSDSHFSWELQPVA